MMSNNTKLRLASAHADSQRAIQSADRALDSVRKMRVNAMREFSRVHTVLFDEASLTSAVKQ